MRWKSLLHLSMFILSIENSYGANSETSFPHDVVKFIEDRQVCDHFRGEPRDFDRSYLESGGEKAEREQAERAEFLEQKTKELCTGMDVRIDKLKQQYLTNAAVLEKLDEYDYIEVKPTTSVTMHKYFPNAKLLEQKLKKVVWNIKWLDDESLPIRWTIQIGHSTDVATAQRIIKTCLEFGPKDLGVEVLAKEGVFHYYYSVTLGGNVDKLHPVYEGDEIKKLLSPDLSQEYFDKLARKKEAYCDEKFPDGLVIHLPCR